MAAAQSPNEKPGPVPLGGRIRELDILRGFALFGVLLVNLRFIGSPHLYWEHADVEGRWPGFPDRAAEWLIQVFVVAKFLSLFSFLFGLGFAIMMRRAGEKETSFAPIYSRRLLALLGFGLLHSLLLWYGDILATYAVLGFLMLAFRGRSERSLLAWATIALLVPIVLTAAAGALGDSGPQSGSDDQLRNQAMAAESIRAYRSKDFGEIMARRVGDLSMAYAQTAPFFTFNFAMFLLGLYAGRRGIFDDITGHLGLLRRVRRWGLVLGVAGNLLAVLALRYLGPGVAFLGVLAFSFGAPALGFFYGSSVVLLAQRERWRRCLGPVAAIGRTALSNYILQSLIATTLFYGYGLGLYARWGPATDIPLAIGIYSLEMALSVGWLRRFRFGPLEWVWRSLTYWKRQPILVGERGSSQS